MVGKKGKIRPTPQSNETDVPDFQRRPKGHFIWRPFVYPGTTWWPNKCQSFVHGWKTAGPGFSNAVFFMGILWVPSLSDKESMRIAASPDQCSNQSENESDIKTPQTFHCQSSGSGWDNHSPGWKFTFPRFRFSRRSSRWFLGRTFNENKQQIVAGLQQYGRG